MTRMFRPRLSEQAAVLAVILFVVLLLVQMLFMQSALLSFLLMVFVFALLRNIHEQRQARLARLRVSPDDGDSPAGVPLLQHLSSVSALQDRKFEIVSVRRVGSSGEPPDTAKVTLEYDDPRGCVQMVIIAAAYWAVSAAGWLVWFSLGEDPRAQAQAATAALVLSIFVLPALLVGMALKLPPLSLLVLGLSAGVLHHAMLSQPGANEEALATVLLREHTAAAFGLGWFPAILTATAVERWSASLLNMRLVLHLRTAGQPEDA